MGRRNLSRVRADRCRGRSRDARQRGRSRQDRGAGARRSSDASAAIGNRERARDARAQRQTRGIGQGKNGWRVEMRRNQYGRIGEHQIACTRLIRHHRGQVGARWSLQERRNARAQTGDARDRDVGRSGGVARGVLIERREVSGNRDAGHASRGSVFEDTRRQRRQSLTVDLGDGRG